MSVKPIIAYYAPLKPPDHPIPSGDRRMARMLLAALNNAGYDAFLVSRYIAYSKRYAREYMISRRDGALEEANRLIKEWDEKPFRPDLFFCFHNYCKAPNWLGMEICQRLDIPLVNGKTCKTGQGPNGEWDEWRAEAQKAIRMAETNIVMTHADKAYLDSFIEPEKIVFTPPFIDPDTLSTANSLSDGTKPDELWCGATPDTLRLFAIGMMRPGAKMDSYQVLSDALETLQDKNWSLVIAGGGPGLEDVKTMFGWDERGRVNIVGELKPDEIMLVMEHTDAMTWPGCREAYGMVYLESAYKGKPAIALDNMGVPLVVAHNRSGLLANPPNAENYAQCLLQLLDNPGLAKKLGDGAKDFVENERSPAEVSRVLKKTIDPVLAAAKLKRENK